MLRMGSAGFMMGKRRRIVVAGVARIFRCLPAEYGRSARPRASLRLRRRGPQPTAGAMLWLPRKRFSGSHSRFRAASRAYFCAP